MSPSLAYFRLPKATSTSAKERDPLLPFMPRRRPSSSPFAFLDDRRSLTLILLAIAAPAALYYIVTPSSSAGTGIQVPGNWVYSPATYWVGSSDRIAGMGGQASKTEEMEEELGVIEDVDENESASEQEEEEDVDVKGGKDYSKYRWHDDVRWPRWGRGQHDDEKLILIGDLHGMVDSFETLLKKLDYRQDIDTLILVGDLVAKHPSIDSSLLTLRRARQLGAIGVRGNHDQMVLDWRGWMEEELGASPFLLSSAGDGSSEPDWSTAGLGWLGSQDEEGEVETEMRRKGLRVPSGWKWRSQHRDIARRLPKREYEYLLSFPLTIHIPNLHLYTVHAGLLPWSLSSSPLPSPSSTSDDDPTHPSLPISSPIPPLAPTNPNLTTSTLTSLSPYHFSPSSSLRSALASRPERSLLLVEQNTDPWVLQNMRGVKKSGRPSKKGKKGLPWFDYWADEMDVCSGRRVEEERKKKKKQEIPKDCEPVTVVYGHWAARGLEIGSYSVGLDSGAVYGRKMSALVVSKADVGVKAEAGWEESEAEVNREKGVEVRKVRLADGTRGRVISMETVKPE